MYFDIDDELVFDPLEIVTESDWYKYLCDILWGDGPIIADLTMPPEY